MATTDLAAGGILGWDETGIGHHLLGRGEAANVTDLGDTDGGDEWANTGDRLQQGICRVRKEEALDLVVRFSDELGKEVHRPQLLIQHSPIGVLKSDLLEPAPTPLAKNVGLLPLVAAA